MLHNHHESVYLRIHDTQSALLSSGNASVCTMTQVGVCQSCAQARRHRAQVDGRPGVAQPSRKCILAHSRHVICPGKHRERFCLHYDTGCRMPELRASAPPSSTSGRPGVAQPSRKCILTHSRHVNCPGELREHFCLHYDTGCRMAELRASAPPWSVRGRLGVAQASRKCSVSRSSTRFRLCRSLQALWSTLWHRLAYVRVACQRSAIEHKRQT